MSENSNGFVDQFPTSIKYTLIKNGINSKEDLYNLVSKHGYIRNIGAKKIEIINEKLDRKICLMTPKNVKEDFGFHTFTRTVTPLQFADELVKGKKGNKQLTEAERKEREQAAESLEKILDCIRERKSCRVDEEALRIAIRELRREHEA